MRRIAVPLLVAALVAGCSHGGPSAAPSPGPSIGQGIDAPVPAPAAAATLVTSSGRRLNLATLAGKVVVVSDMMTLCQETCPLDTANVVAAARRVEQAGLGDKVEFLSVTIDPQRDTPSRLAAYRELYKPAPRNWQLATGTPAQLSAMWRAMGVYIHRVADKPPAPRDWLTGKPLTYDLTHSDELFFIDPHGHERFVLDGAPHVAPGAPIPARLWKFLDATGHRHARHPDAMAWTLPQEMQVISWLLDRRVT